MRKKHIAKPPAVEQEETVTSAEGAEEVAVSSRVAFMVTLINKFLQDGRAEASPELVEKVIKIVELPTPPKSKQRTYAIKRLETAEYKRSREAGEAPAAITEEQILAEMERMEKAKQAKAAKKETSGTL